MGSRYNFIQDDVGYLMAADDDILMGRRDIRSVENTIDMTYFLDSRKWIKVRFRKLLSNATFDPVLFRLLDDGYREITDYTRLDFDPNTKAATLKVLSVAKNLFAQQDAFWIIVITI